MRIVTKIVLLLFFFHLTPAFSTESNIPKPQEFFVGSADYDKIIKFKCTNGASESEVICNTILISLDNDARFRNSFFKAENNVDLDESSLKEMQKAIRDNQFLNEDRINKHEKQRTDGQKQYLSDLSSAIKKVRSATDYKQLKQAVKEFTEIQSNTCQVYVFNQEPYIFKNTEGKKWTSTTKIYKYCNVDLVQELMPSENGGDTWNLVQTYTEPKNNGDQSCKKTYSRHQYIYPAGRASYITAPQCKYIELK